MQQDRWLNYVGEGIYAAGFKEMAQTVTSGKVTFTDEEMMYVVNAFSFTVVSDQRIDKLEFQEWLFNRSGVFIL